MKPVLNLCFAFLILLLTGCANTPATDGTVQTVAAPKLSATPVQDEARLYVLNISGPTLFPGNQDITDNGAMIASLPRATYKSVNIAAGMHEFRFAAFPKGSRVAKLEAEQGKIYYLAAGYSPGRSWAFPFAGDPVTIKLISEGDAINLMKEMKPQ